MVVVGVVVVEVIVVTWASSSVMPFIIAAIMAVSIGIWGGDGVLLLSVVVDVCVGVVTGVAVTLG